MLSIRLPLSPTALLSPISSYYLLAALLMAPASATAAKAVHSPSVSKQEISHLLAAETKLPEKEIADIMAGAKFLPDVIEKITRPWESRPYSKYRTLFITEKMKAMGQEYLREHADLLSATTEKYQVEAELIAAILGMETRFGRITGNDRLLDSLYTLASGYPRRADFFRGQLGALLLLSREEKLDAGSLKGSYAGAFGATQFIPTSYRDFAVDADGDGKRDVFHSQKDIAASVANYFHKHGWQAGRPVAYWLPMDVKVGKQWRERAKGNLKQWVRLAELRKLLPHIPAPWRDDDKVSIIEMQTKHGKQLALVHYNFYVITRWNRSYNYAMAITEVAAMLERKTFAVD